MTPFFKGTDPSKRPNKFSRGGGKCQGVENVREIWDNERVNINLNKKVYYV
jgi:hypothetical protein